MQHHYSIDENILEVGLDECARGCLFGSVITAAVIWKRGDTNIISKKIKDSKKLSSKQHAELYNYIIENCIDYAIDFGEVEEIDKYNISNTVFNSMHRCIDKLKIKPNLLLVDGSYFRKYKMIEHINIPKGDNKFISIACASIIAKHTHTEYIKQLCIDNPELDEKYSLLSNKSYGTLKHINGIKGFGITKYHRKYFGICKNYNKL